MSDFDLQKLRPGKDGIRGAFEEFCCQLFRRSEEDSNWQYRRINGAGGDGGVEAVWEKQDGSVWGLQAKYFFKFTSSEKGQMKESLDQAIANYDSLSHYTYCLPASLTGKKGSRAKRPTNGQHETLEKWREEWIAEYEKQGRTIEIDFWDESELLTRLTTVDCNGGMRRYWFERDVFSEQWFTEHLIDAEAQAGKRYTPKLTIKTPLSSSLEFFGRTESSIKNIQETYRSFAKEIRWFESIITGSPDESIEKLEEELTSQAIELQEQSKSILATLHKFMNTPERASLSDFFSNIKAALQTAYELEPKVKASLERKHGEHADSKGFRQWSAEYMVSFPMAPLDHLRDLTQSINTIRNLDIELFISPVMLVKGPAGIGKTHAVIDSGKARDANGLHSCIVFGEDFNNDEPWIRIAHKLGLSDTGRDQLLEILDAAGESTGHPLIIFVDALNETSPDRTRWKSWLPPMIEQVRRYPFVKLCVTCRDTYLREVLSTSSSLPQVNHNGFADRVYDAIFQFFSYYGLGLPSGPMLQEEFSNPLFLHLICEALQSAGQSTLPSGSGGFLEVVDLLIREKNKRIAQECDYDSRQNLVKRAILAISALMAENNTRLLPLEEVIKVTEDIIPRSNHSRSLVNILEKESLLSVIERQGGGLGGNPSFQVRFTFERIGDHFITEHLLTKLTDIEVNSSMQPGGALHFMIEDEAAAQEFGGLLEAASLLFVEKFNKELPDFCSKDNDLFFLKPFIHALNWRAPESISDLTIEYFESALRHPEVTRHAMDTLLKVSIRKNNPLNATYLHKLLNRMPRLIRDTYLAYQLEDNYSGWSEIVHSDGAVATLINWSLHAPLAGIDTEVAVLWGTSFAWFLASPDRRIRDKATKGLVRIAKAEPMVLPSLLKKFLYNDDEYIVERVLVAAYGALLLHPTPESVKATASVVIEWFAPPHGEGPPTTNAIIRDHARSIVEIAQNIGLLSDLPQDLFKPPFQSDWPIRFSRNEDIAKYANDNDRYPNLDLNEPLGIAQGTDFARYIISPQVIQKFDCKSAEIKAGDVYRWFLAELVSDGYPGPNDRCATFDKITISNFGAGRGKPGWAERLGKKYYWTYLHKLVGRFADHLPRVSWDDTIIPPSDYLQGVDLRKIDPTDTRACADAPPDCTEWIVKHPSSFSFSDNPGDDSAWIASNDFPKIRDLLTVQAPDQTEWILLNLSKSWTGPRLGEDSSGSYRHISRYIHTAFCRAKDTALIKNKFKQKEWPIQEPIRSPEDYKGYLGEYPNGLGYTKRPDNDLRYTSEYDGFTLTHSGLLQLKGTNWEYDYSTNHDVPNLWMPSPGLIEYGDLKWDGYGGWSNDENVTQVQATNWYGNSVNALIARLDFIDQYLTDKYMGLVITGFQQKLIANANRSSGIINEEFSVLLRSSKRVYTLGIRVEER